MANYKLANGNIIVADQGFIDKFYPGAERLPDAIPDPDDAINQQLAAIDASTGMTRLSRELWVLQLGVKVPKTLSDAEAAATALRLRLKIK